MTELSFADLRADCRRCVGLCCVAPAFSVSADFAIDKPAGRPCPNLAEDFRCSIHVRLRDEGFPGCVAYDCFGAGQRVTQTTFAGADWRRSPHVAERMFAVFSTTTQLHQLLWYLTEALTRPEAAPLFDDLRAVAAQVERLANGGAEALRDVDASGLRRAADPLLRRTSELVRAGHSRRDLSGVDLIGSDLRGADLRSANLRNAVVVGADLTGADLRRADLIGADLRGADLSGADLTDSIFLTDPQVGAANGDLRTRLPDPVKRPRHWTADREAREAP